MTKLYAWLERNVVDLSVTQEWDKEEMTVFVARAQFKGDCRNQYESDPEGSPDFALTSLRKKIIEGRLNDAAKELKRSQEDMIAVEAWGREE